MRKKCFEAILVLRVVMHELTPMPCLSHTRLYDMHTRTEAEYKYHAPTPIGKPIITP